MSSSKGKTARNNLFINFMVVALLVEGGKFMLVAVNFGENKRHWQFISSIRGSASLSSQFG